METWGLDIEADGLLPTVTFISTFNITNIRTGESRTYTKDGVLGYETVEVGVEFVKNLLECGDNLIIHNSQYDIGVLHKLYGLDLLKYFRQIYDTMILSQLIYTQIDREIVLNKNTPMPYSMQHGLKSWGMRLGSSKLETDNYTVVTPELIEYLEQDVRLMIKLYKFLLLQKNYPRRSIIQMEVWNTLECAIYPIYGWQIDVGILNKLTSKYTTEIIKVDVALANMFEPYYTAVNTVIPTTETIRNSSRWVEVRDIPNSVGKAFVCDVGYTKVGKPKTNKKWNTFLKEEDGVWYRKVNITTSSIKSDIVLEYFKAGSRQSIVNFFNKKYGYTFNVLSDTGNPVLNEDVLGGIDLVEAPLLKIRFKNSKDLSMLQGLKNNMLGDRVYGNINVLGATSTGRSSASGGITVGFNLQQQSSAEEYRRMFTASKDRVFLTADLSSAELMLQGIVMRPFDNGKFIDILVKGDKKHNTDLHSINATNTGVSRQDAKVLWYASSYGASGLLVAHNINPSDDVLEECTVEEFDRESIRLHNKATTIEGKQYISLKKGINIPLTSKVVKLSIWGTKLKNTLSNSLDGYSELLKALGEEVKSTGGITSLDGRFITVDSSHKALNYKLQSGNAVLTKLWKFFSYTHMMKKHPIIETWLPLAVVHDEVNIECDKDVVDDMVESLRIGLLKANKYLKLPVNVECDIGVGNVSNNTWSMH